MSLSYAGNSDDMAVILFASDGNRSVYKCKELSTWQAAFVLWDVSSQARNDFRGLTQPLP
jgi:hypothetical protein